jgi:L-threonylcarbamoyladenylate synthase
VKTIVTKDTDLCAQLLLKSELVAFPTETVYGLGAVSTDPVAVSKVYSIKNRPADNPLISHFYSFEQIKQYAIDIPDYLELLIRTFSPGPISYILNIPSDSPLIRPVGRTDMIFRIPNQPQTLDLIRKLNLPLAGPSSNLSGRPSHTNPDMVLSELDGKISAVLDGGESQIGLESTILECKDPDVCKILRPGKIGIAEIQALFDKHNLQTKVIIDQFDDLKVVPGNKYPHYSPQTPVIKLILKQSKAVFESITSIPNKIAIIASTKDVSQISSHLPKDVNDKIEFIDMGDTLESYAHNLYKNLQLIDQIDVELAYLVTYNWGSSSLATALENRLSKVGV